MTGSGRGLPRRLPEVRYGKAVVSAVLHTHLVHSLLDAHLCELRFPTPEPGGQDRRPVGYVRRGDELVVRVDGQDDSRWWYPFTMPYPVRVLLRRRWYQGLARALAAGQPGWLPARSVYAERFSPDLLSDSDIYLLIGLRHRVGRASSPVVPRHADA